MANLKRNMIELVVGVNGEEVVTEKYWTPAFIPMTIVYQAIDIMAETEKEELSERDAIDRLLDFVANEIYQGKFSKDELLNGLHAPDAIKTLQEQILFIAQGQQTNETKKFLEKKS
ncbi:MAG: hypothetical protein LPK00_00070 [Bacillaceae bacterium]|nr:hypothetical protein [Bacillaceae bacterium]